MKALEESFNLYNNESPTPTRTSLSSPDQQRVETILTDLKRTLNSDEKLSQTNLARFLSSLEVAKTRGSGKYSCGLGLNFQRQTREATWQEEPGGVEDKEYQNVTAEGTSRMRLVSYIDNKHTILHSQLGTNQSRF